MPYIKQDDRDYLRPLTDEISNIDIDSSGQLNYLITMLLIKYMDSFTSVCYESINDCIGALEGAKLELYRRLAASYEDEKITENGDIY